MISAEKQTPVFRILVVDDEPDILRFLSRSFLGGGYSVVTANDSEKALEYLKRDHFNLVLSDIKMPGLDGLTLLKKVKESSPTTEVIMMTGYASVESAVGSIKMGAFDYLPKPFTLQEILTVVKRALEHYEAIHDLSQYRDWEQTKEDFLRNTSHELRTPLTSIMSASKFLVDEFKREGELKGSAHARILTIVHRNSNRMLQLIDDLLESFRFGAGKVVLNKTRFSVEKMMKETVEEFLAPCQERRLRLHSRIEHGLPGIEGDPVKIRQAVLNLIGNAMKFTRAGGEITLGAKAGRLDGAPAVEIVVKDSGVGIPPDLHGKVFDKFYQLDSSTTRTAPGLGLGLALVKSIAEAHGGSVGLESRPGWGSAFSVTLPVNAAVPADQVRSDYHVAA